MCRCCLKIFSSLALLRRSENLKSQEALLFLFSLLAWFVFFRFVGRLESALRATKIKNNFIFQEVREANKLIKERLEFVSLCLS